MNDIFVPQPVISIIIKDGWPKENSAAIIVGAPELADGVYELYTAPQLTPAAVDVLAERQRQINVKGWTPEHDDWQNQYGDLTIAASCYARHAYGRGWVYPEKPERYQDEEAPDDWPWDDTWWKPDSPRRDLIKATALLLAELERLDRLSQRNQK
ncbi:hypothetical protein LGD22_004587 [Salmonella enterica]|nr:hypothetical protein [Salmonella enterica]ELG4931729.1 hypothetical protein [Salmonella enterica]